PNPCSSSTDIYYKLPSGKDDYSLVLSDPAGRILLRQHINPAQTHATLNVSALPDGMYFYRVASAGGKGSQVKKLVVQH
ncbi:MAG: T9SS type A sorting domain-containing protein, partial [Chitinophagaceae bacterium]